MKDPVLGGWSILARNGVRSLLQKTGATGFATVATLLYQILVTSQQPWYVFN